MYNFSPEEDEIMRQCREEFGKLPRGFNNDEWIDPGEFILCLKEILAGDKLSIEERGMFWGEWALYRLSKETHRLMDAYKAKHSSWPRLPVAIRKSKDEKAFQEYLRKVIE